jgi:hypothetical protein
MAKTVKKSSIRKAQGGDTLSTKDLSALAHQKRGMGEIDDFFVKKAGPIKNELGVLTSAQKKQLSDYMKKSGTAKKIYEGLPNIGRAIGKSAADIPKGSKLEKQKSGGKTMLKRADGSTSQRGLWDNIRNAAKKNKAAGKPGKKPTAAMLKQEKKIKAASKKK